MFCDDTLNQHCLKLEFVNFDANGKEICTAREKYFAISNNSVCKKNSSKTQGTLFNFCSAYPVQQELPQVYPEQKKDTNRSNEIKYSEPTGPTRVMPTVQECVDEKDDNVTCHGLEEEIAFTEPTTGGKLASADCKSSVPYHSHSCRCEQNTSLLNSKMDALIKTVRELKIKTSRPAPAKPVVSSYLGLQNNKVIDWKNINNIINLTQSIPEIKFYGGNNEKSPSILRCENSFSCFQAG